eukprot:TRINITY_DN33327_c0_g1_i1.p1 TRINITY_DN33327_c0_g1~~TRINITY_DN33327_c0_g1_i1.p1  ORF type:complete len:590 (+),score=109.89 TRINITY_DN33327_c0_g1_i1:83-1852(+)
MRCLRQDLFRTPVRAIQQQCRCRSAYVDAQGNRRPMRSRWRNRGVHPDARSLEKNLQYHALEAEHVKRTQRNRELRQGLVEPVTEEERAIAKYKHGSKYADANARKRDSHAKILQEMAGPFSLDDLVKLSSNPLVDDERKPPPEVMKMLLDVRSKTHLDVKAGDRTPGRRQRRMDTQVSASARRIVSEHRHGDQNVSSPLRKYVRVTTGPRNAPVRFASAKAMLVFGAKSFVRLKAMCVDSSKFPPPSPNLPEVVFLGRSGQGKSALINCITNRRVNTIGRGRAVTRFATFISCGANASGNVCLIDTPGHHQGYLEAEERYLGVTLDCVKMRHQAGVLKGAVFIVPHHGIGESDRQQLELLEELEVPFLAVLCKSDICQADELEQLVTEVEVEMKGHPYCRGIHLTSARHKKGIAKLQTVIAEWARIPAMGHKVRYNQDLKGQAPTKEDRDAPPPGGFDFDSILPAFGLEKLAEGREQRSALPARVRRWHRFFQTRAQKHVEEGMNRELSDKWDEGAVTVGATPEAEQPFTYNPLAGDRLLSQPSVRGRPVRSKSKIVDPSPQLVEALNIKVHRPTRRHGLPRNYVVLA